MTAGSSFLFVCRLTTGLSCFLVLVGASRGQEDVSEKTSPLAALYNPLLRDHFRGQFVHLYKSHSSAGHSHFAEVFVDRRIKSFLGDVEKKLQELEVSLQEFRAIREEVLKEGKARIDGKLRQRWKKRSKKISESSESLRKKLSYVFFQLQPKDNFRPAVNASPDNRLFSVEIKYMTRQSHSASESIKSYLFSSGQTVDINDLTGSNMLICLYHVSQIARLLRDRI